MSGAPLIEGLLSVDRVVRFEPKPVSRDDVFHLMAAARLAPSARNSQIWLFSIFQDRETICRAAEFAGAPNWADAGAVVAARGKPAFFGRLHQEQPFLMIDVPIAMSHVTLAAGERRLAVEWVWARDEKGWSDLLTLGATHRLAAVGFVGFAAETAPREAPPGQGVFHDDFVAE
jgi:hypothetical protein